MGKIIDNATDMYVPRTGTVCIHRAYGTYGHTMYTYTRQHAAAVRPYVAGVTVVCAAVCARGYVRAAGWGEGEGRLEMDGGGEEGSARKRVCCHKHTERGGRGRGGEGGENAA